MVYRGKLSKGCAECRAKKTRCDGARPSCGQCRRAGRTCSGYRNLQELRVVDQSNEVLSKLAKPRARQTSPPDSGYESGVQSHSSPSTDSQSSQEQLLDVSMVRTFPEPSYWIEGTARNVFFSQYINIGTGYLKTELTFVPPIHKATRTDSMLENIISALGMAVLRKQNSDVSYLAAQKYAIALRQTQRALQNPKMAKSDETLATVLLLGLHDLVTVDDSGTEYAASSVHLQGAARLLQLRDIDQIDEPAGARMFLRVYKQILETCLYNKTRIPPILLTIQRKLRTRMNDGEAANADLIEIAARLCDIIASPNTQDNPVGAIKALHDIDNDLLAWKKSLDFMHTYQKIPIRQPDKSFLTHQDMYVNHLSAASWNNYRSMRIRLHEGVILLLSLTPCTEAQTSTSTNSASIIREMSQEICHSVPYYLGPGSLYEWEETRSTPPNMYGGAAMLMPLYFASNKDVVGPAMYEWLMGQVQKIARETGIARARGLLREKSVDRGWITDG